MNSKPKRSVISAKSVRKVAANASKKTGSALSVVAKRLHADPGVVKHARATLKGLPSRTKKFVKSNPVRVLLGASAIGFVLAKLKHLV
jgi:ElaB/YqjD/DUF883 family membrane-anchored ribosome-binding protein